MGSIVMESDDIIAYINAGISCTSKNFTTICTFFNRLHCNNGQIRIEVKIHPNLNWLFIVHEVITGFPINHLKKWVPLHRSSIPIEF
ncbi:unnamed protein product [Citrullus colocynthis]|uniref:Uncharacterized protein n=1 Tax=Citrullus colocynthis TaxID=252529 RepID=A0ABP0YF50_9ROSI